MINAEKAQAAIDAIREVCNERGVVLYGSSYNESQPAEIVIVASEDWIWDDEPANEVIAWHGEDYLYASSIGDATANSKTQGEK